MLRIEAPQLRDHFLRHAVAEVFLTCVPGKVFEGENCQHSSSPRPEGPDLELEPLAVNSPTSNQDDRCRKNRYPKQSPSSKPGSRILADRILRHRGHRLRFRIGTRNWRNDWRNDGRNETIAPASGSSFRACRILRMAPLILLSVSRKTPLPQIRSMICSRETVSPFFSISRTRISVGMRSSFKVRPARDSFCERRSSSKSSPNRIGVDSIRGFQMEPAILPMRCAGPVKIVTAGLRNPVEILERRDSRRADGRALWQAGLYSSLRRQKSLLLCEG